MAFHVKPPPLVMAMTAQEFERALRDWGEYSCSLPTGTTPGKRWLRNQTAYEDPSNEGMIGIRWYRVLIVEATT
jgi:hypothetical protein